MLLRRKRTRPAVCGNRNTHPAPVPVTPAESLEARRLMAVTVFTIQPDLSRITLSAEAVGVNLSRQETGSLTARYDGTIAADVTPGGIRFLGGSDMVAEMRGRFDPGDAPGNYAGQARQFTVTIAEAAIRNLRLDVLSAALTTDSLGNFPSNSVNVAATGGTFDYDINSIGEGTFNLAGPVVANSTTTPSNVVQVIDGTARLTMPVDVTYTYNNPPAELHLRGQIVAVAPADRGLRPRIDAHGGAIGTGYRSMFITTPGATPVAVVDAAGLTVSDYDSPALAGATVVLDPVPNQPDELLTVDTGVTPINSSYDAATGTLTLTGNGSPAQYQQVLRTLTYDNNAAEPAFSERTMRITLSDEVGAGASAVNTISVEEPFNVNVARIGTNAGPQGGRTVTFVDADGTITTVNLIGGGHAYVRFTGAATQLLQNGAITIGGTDVQLQRIDVSGTNALSKLAMRVVGGADRAVNLGGVVSTGPLQTVGGKGVNLTGDLDVNGRVVKATFNNVTNADITATDILKMTVAGALTNSDITLSAPSSPLVPVLGSLAVKGAITDSRISAAGNLGSIKAASLVGSEIYAGIAGTDRFPSVAADFANEAFLAKLTLKAPLGTAAFDNSVVAANNMGRISLGLIDTDNGGVPFGVAADVIAGLSGTNAAGQRLTLTRLDDPNVLAAALPALPFTFGDFQIHLV